MGYDGSLKFDTKIDTSGFEQGTSKMGEMAKNALSVFAGNLMMNAASKIVELGQLALQSGTEFEAAMAKASTLYTGTDAEFEKLSSDILKLSSNTGLAASSLAEAAYSAESASVPAEQLGAMLEHSSKLAAAGFTDVDTALSATAKTMNAYGLEGEDAMEKVQKVLMQTQNLGITTVGELGHSLASVTPTAAAFGVSFEQVGAALSVMTAQGVSTAEATTKLKSMFSELGKSGTTAAKNLAKAAEGTEYAGMSFSQMMDNGADLSTVLEMLGKQAEKDGLSMLDMFSNVDAGNAALSVFSNKGQTFTEDLKQMGTAADVVGEAYEKVSDTVEFKTNQLQTSLKNLSATAEKAVAGDFKNALDVGNDAIGRMQSALESGGFSGLAQEAVKIGGEMAVQIASGIMEGIPKVTEAAVGILHSMTEGIQSKLPDLIPVAMNALVTFSGSIRSNVGTIVDAGLELVMALADSLVQNIPVFVQTVPTIVTNIAGLINDNAPKILSCGVQIIGKLVGGIISALPVIAQNIPQIIQAIVSVLMAFNWMNIGKSIITMIKNGVKALTTAVPNALKNIGETAVEWLKAIDWATLGADLIDLIVIGVQTLATAIPDALLAIGTNAVGFIQGIDWLGVGSFLVEGIISGISGMAEAAVAAIKGVGESILGGFKSFFGISSPSTVMEEQGNFMIDGILNALNNLPGAIGGCLSEALSAVKQWGSDTAANAKEAASGALNNVQTNFSQIPGKIGGQLNTALSNVTNWGAKTVSGIKANTTNALNAVKTNFTAMTTQIGSQLTSALAKVTSWGTNTLSKIRTLTNSAVSAAKAAFSLLPPGVQKHLSTCASKVVSWGSQLASNGRAAANACKNAVTNALSSLPGKIVSIGENIASGLARGIRNGISWVADAARDIANRALNAAKNALGISSPSKVFEKEVGQWIPPGIGKGITRAMPKMESETLKQMQAMAEHMRTSINEEVAARIGMVRLKSGFYDEDGEGFGSGTTNNTYNIVIQQPVKTPSEMARAIRLEQQYGLAGD